MSSVQCDEPLPLPPRRFAPDKRWHVDNMVQVLTQAGAYVKEEVCRAFIVLVTNAPDLHGYAVRAMYRNLHAYQVGRTCVWFVGVPCR